MPVPFVVAQHMPPTFTRLFAERVNKLTPFEVREGRDGEMLEAGKVYIAPGGVQSEVRRIAEGLQLRVFPASDGDLYAPSVDRLINTASMACRAIAGARAPVFRLSAMAVAKRTLAAARPSSLQMRNCCSKLDLREK